MKISECIKQLEELKDIAGDVDVAVQQVYRVDSSDDWYGSIRFELQKCKSWGWEEWRSDLKPDRLTDEIVVAM